MKRELGWVVTVQTTRRLEAPLFIADREAD
jgi:hypothetical protein